MYLTAIFRASLFSPLLPSRPHALGSCSSLWLHRVSAKPVSSRYLGTYSIPCRRHRGTCTFMSMPRYGLASPSTGKCCNLPETPDRLPARTTPRALWFIFLLHIAAEPPDIEAECWPGSSPALCSAHQHPAPGTRSPIWRFGHYCTSYSCYTACRYAAGHGTMQQPLDAGSFSTAYQYVIVSLDMVMY